MRDHVTVACLIVVSASVGSLAEDTYFDNRTLKPVVTPRFSECCSHSTSVRDATRLDIQKGPLEQVRSEEPIARTLYQVIHREAVTSGSFTFEFFGGDDVEFAVSTEVTELNPSIRYSPVIDLNDGNTVGPDLFEMPAPSILSGVYGFSFGAPLLTQPDDFVCGVRLAYPDGYKYGYVWFRWIEQLAIEGRDHRDEPSTLVTRAYQPLGWGVESELDVPIQVFKPVTTCACDLVGGDNRVDLEDLLSYVAQWLEFSGLPPRDPRHPDGNLNLVADDRIDIADLLTFVDCYLTAREGRHQLCE